MTVLPTFSGNRRNNVYKDWKQSISAYQHGFNTPAEQLAPRVWLGLEGEAREVVTHLDIESELAKPDGMKVLMKVLDAVFGKEKVGDVEDAIESFWNYRRGKQPSMETYLTAMRTLRLRMRQQDPDTKTSDQAYNLRLLKQAGLSREERKPVLAPAGAK